MGFVQDVVKDFTEKKIVSHFILSQETGEKVKPCSMSSGQMFQLWKNEILILETAGFSLGQNHTLLTILGKLGEGSISPRPPPPNQEILPSVILFPGPGQESYDQ